MPKVNKLISYKKCRRCRHDRQKCLPDGRVWPGPKCKRCQYFNYGCSESCTKAEELLSLPTVENITRGAQEPHDATEPSTFQNEVESITHRASELSTPQNGGNNTSQSRLPSTRDVSLHEALCPALDIHESFSKTDTECLQEYDDLFQLRDSFYELESESSLNCWILEQLDSDGDGQDVTDILSARLQHTVALLKRRAIVSEADCLSHNNGEPKEHLFCNTSIRSAIRADFEREQLDMSKATVGHSRILASLYGKGQASIAMEIQEKTLHRCEMQDYRLSEFTVNALLREYERFANRIRESWINDSWEWLGAAVLAIVLRVIKVGVPKLARRVLPKFSSDIWKAELTDLTILKWSYFLGAEYNARDVVLWAIEQIHLEIDCREGFLKRTALHIAALCGSTCVAELLIKKGANLEAEDSTQGTPLNTACRRLDNATMVTLLMNSGANINNSGWIGRTPLHDAITHNNLEAGQLLLSFGADTNPETSLYYRAITRALSKDEPIALEWIRLLTKHRANLDVRKMSEGSARRFVEVVAKSPVILLCQLLCPQDPTNTSTKLDTHTATLILREVIRLGDECEGMADKIKLLLAFGANLDAPNLEGNAILPIPRQSVTDASWPRVGSPSGYSSFAASTSYLSSV